MPSDAYSTAILALAPSAYYRLDETSGTVCTDSSGNGYNLTYGSSVQLGAPSLLLVDSGDKCINIATTNTSSAAYTAHGSAREPLLEPTTTYTVAFWVNIHSISDTLAYQWVVYGADTGTEMPMQCCLSPGIPPSPNDYTQIIFSMTPGGSQSAAVFSTLAPVANTTYFVVGTLSGGYLNLYINGSVDATPFYAPGTVTGYTSPYGLTIGGDAGYIGSGGNAYIDEVAIWGNTALTAAQIANLYTIGTNTSTTTTESFTASIAPTAPGISITEEEFDEGIAPTGTLAVNSSAGPTLESFTASIAPTAPGIIFTEEEFDEGIAPAGALTVSSGQIILTSLEASLNLEAPGALITGKSFTAFLGLTAPGAFITGRAFTAVLAPIGVLAKGLAQIFPAVVGPIASISRAMSLQLAGVLSTTVGNFLTSYIAGTIGEVVAGALTLSGNVSRAISRAFTASTAVGGVLSSTSTVVVGLAASITPIAATITKSIIGVLFGIVSVVGSGAKRITGILAGVIAPIISFTRVTATILSASSAPFGAISRVVNGVLTGAIALVGSLLSGFPVTLAGALGVSSSFVLITVNRLLSTVTNVSNSGFGLTIQAVVVGTLAFTGSFIKAAAKVFTGTIALFAGTIPRAILRAFSGVISLGSSVLGSLHQHFATFMATISLTSTAISKVIFSTLTAATNALAALVATVNGTVFFWFTSSTEFAGSVAKGTSTFLDPASIASLGALAKGAVRSLAGALGAIGSYTWSEIFAGGAALLSAALAPIGVVGKQTSSAFTAALAAIGILAKATQRTLGTGSAALIGAITRSINRNFSAVSNFAGFGAKQTIRQLAAFVAFFGAQAKVLSRAMAGAAALAGTVARLISALLSGLLDFSGSSTRVIARTLNAAIALASLDFLRIVLGIMLASLEIAGSISRSTWRALTAALSAVGNIALVAIGILFETFTATLATAGTIERTFTRLFPAIINALGTITRQFQLPFTAATTSLQQLGNFLAFAIHVYAQNFGATIAATGALSKTANRTLGATITSAGNMAWQNILAAFTSLVGTLRAIFVVYQAPQRHFRLSTEIIDTISLSTPIYPGAWRTSSTA